MKKGFTLIELLIVVAIIAILAAIAVPNFLEAQTRAKVSRGKSDLRTAATALETYNIDHNAFPYCGFEYNNGIPVQNGHQWFNYWFLSKHLSTPIAYLTSANIKDPFRKTLVNANHWQIDDVRYTNVEATWGTKFDALEKGNAANGASIHYGNMMHEFGGWRMICVGPDRVQNPVTGIDGGWPGISTQAPYTYPLTALPNPYDPTNGTLSRGDILRSQKATNGYVNAQ